jgi:hypothetical protein
MTMSSRTALSYTFAIVSMAMLATHPARADNCKWFGAVHQPVSSPCQLEFDDCGRKLDAAATAAYGLWKKSNFRAEPLACTTAAPINCTAYYCRVFIRRPLQRKPPATQAHPPLNSSYRAH